ncbi:MAG: molybdopterin molybdotransferase MoeA, partial [Microbacteriaceae bacterium]
ADHPVTLRVIAEVAAGDADDPEMPAGTAVRIMTGAPVPTAASAVIPIEVTQIAADFSNDSGEHNTRANPEADAWNAAVIRVQQPVILGANVRQRGEDIRKGEPIAQAGDELSAVRLSALAAAGINQVPVHRAPRIAVLSTGSELQAIGNQLRRGQIPESNSLLIAGLLCESGFAVTTIDHCADSAEELNHRFALLAATHDAIITTGGVGPGKYDVVRIALAKEPEIVSTRVAIRPGQPQCSGRHSAGAFIFGLPGNPVSAAVSFELFVRPALLRMAGHSRIDRRTLIATAETGWSGKTGSLQVLPITITSTAAGLSCTPSVPANAVSHSVARHGASQGYALLGPERGQVLAGDLVEVIETGTG